MARKVIVGTFNDGSERVVKSLRRTEGMLAFENADDYLTRNVGAFYARMWREAVDGKSRLRGVRWLDDNGLVSRPGASTQGLTWIRYCADVYEASGGDPALRDLIIVSLNKKERALWR